MGPAEFSDCDAAVLGARLPVGAEACIAAAGRVRHDEKAATALLDQAEALAPGHPAVLIARYRMHFYGNRLAPARAVAQDCIGCAARMLGIVGDWPVAQPDARFASFDALPRFYLFALKGFAYLSLRLGDHATGALALAKLAQLDPGDRVGHRVLGAVLARVGHEDADYDEALT